MHGGAYFRKCLRLRNFAWDFFFFGGGGVNFWSRDLLGVLLEA